MNHCENRTEPNHDESASLGGRTHQTAEELAKEGRQAGDGFQLASYNDLPHFNASNPPNFVWGDTDGETLSSRLMKAYEEVVSWKRNLFEVLRGKAGTDFVSEVTRLIEAYSDATSTREHCLESSNGDAQPVTSEASCHVQHQRQHPMLGGKTVKMEEGRP